MTDVDQKTVERYANELRAKIEGGEFGTSGVIPSMNELKALWGIKSTAIIADVIMLLRVQGYLAQSANKRFRVVHPRVTLPGLTPNFNNFLLGLGYKPEEVDIEPPKVEPMPLEIAKLFTRNDNGMPAISDGVHVVHRVRRQGIVDLPMRIGHIWYPSDIAEPYIDAMSKDSHFDMLATLKKEQDISVVETDFVISSRVPDLNEMKELKLARYQPILEIRRIGYTANRERVVTLHRTVMDGTRFEYRLTQTVDHWK